MRINVGTSSLDEYKATETNRINGEISIARARLVPDASMEMLYLMKKTEAEKYLNLPKGDYHEEYYELFFPMLCAESRSTGKILDHSANVILTKYNEWQKKLAAIDSIRRDAKSTIESLQTIQEIHAVASGFVSILSSL